MRKCPVCDGEGFFENFGACDDPECCGYSGIICVECDGEGEVVTTTVSCDVCHGKGVIKRDSGCDDRECCGPFQYPCWACSEEEEDADV